jgi:hypothetical protein
MNAFSCERMVMMVFFQILEYPSDVSGPKNQGEEMENFEHLRHYQPVIQNSLD